ncbi:hypothetical protein ES332_A10G208100v1 [Gossypium tomentosum]|uniref:Uncharacterized protein n=1 Tax=Gossypium tomentosum TaxID=34277 RepID=A0A5D2NT60_GOSTO|nr:hypothetical protein ES332_A10G208100v1 [Gossypium tomentosum]
MQMPQLRMVSKHCCKESILIPVALPSNSKPLDPTLTKNLYCQKLHQTGYAFSESCRFDRTSIVKGH